MAKKAPKVGLTERALIQRVNRKLLDDKEMVKTARGGRAEHELGRHYVVSWEGNGIVHKNIDLEDWARELGVLKAWEGLRS